MPRSRGSEMPQQPQQRQSPRRPPQLKTTSPDSNGAHAHHRGSPKLEDSRRRSPRSPLPEFPARNQRKSGSRVGDLETKLGRAQEELRKLREQLASAEAAKRGAQQELEAAKKLVSAVPPAAGEQETEEHHSSSIATQQDTQKEEDAPPAEAVSSPAGERKIQADDCPEQVPVPAAAAAAEPIMEKEDDDSNVEMVKGEDDLGEAIEGEEGKEEASRMAELEAKLAEMVGKLELRTAENSTLRNQVAEAEAGAGAARAGEAEAASKLSQAAEELARSKARAEQLGVQLGGVEETRAWLEAEVKTLRVQTEQWRKAADAAAAALTASEARERAVVERCPSMERRLGYEGMGSPLEEGFKVGGGRKKGAGIRALGDLWKKKAQQLHK